MPMLRPVLELSTAPVAVATPARLDAGPTSGSVVRGPLPPVEDEAIDIRRVSAIESDEDEAAGYSHVV